jgi:hypothetical protein
MKESLSLRARFGLSLPHPQFRLDDVPQLRQSNLHRIPDDVGDYVLVAPAHVAGARIS